MSMRCGKANIIIGIKIWSKNGCDFFDDLSFHVIGRHGSIDNDKNDRFPIVFKYKRYKEFSRLDKQGRKGKPLDLRRM